MPALLSGEAYSGTFTGASTEGAAITHPTPVKGGYLYFEVAQATLTFKVQVRFFNGREWMAYHDLVDDDLNSSFDPTLAAVQCEFTLKNQAFWKEPIYGVQIKYIRLTGSADATVTKAMARLDI